MTDSSDPAPFSRRDPFREPPTIDLKATSVDEGVRKTAASPEGAEGTEASAAEPSRGTGAEAPSDAPARRALSLGALAGAGLVGGLVGAGLVLAGEAWRTGPSPLDRRIAELENRIEILARGDAVRQAEERIAALKDAQVAVERELRNVQGQAQQAISLAEQAATRAPQAPVAAPNMEALTDLSSRLGVLEMQLRNNAQAATETAQTTARQVEALEGRAAGLEQRIAGLARQVAEGGSADTKAATRIVLADRLGNALREGAPYQDVLDALRRSDADPATLAPLEPFAASGAPTAAALAQSFEPLGERIVREARGGAEDWRDRLMRMAGRIVTVRPVDQPGATSVPGLVARIRNALDRGALVEAVAAWEALPEPARRISADWGRRLKERAAAETAARQAAAHALATLHPPSR